MKKVYPFLSFFLACFLLCPFIAGAQITVIPGGTAAILANKLVGPGIIVLAPTLTCPAGANGTFSGPSSLSFDSGIVLTNGSSTAVANPASAFASTGIGSPGDAQLSALSGHPTFDACVLEFDFRPIGDTVKFQYVFGSEEYTSFTCTVFNDVFGFFISGPGFGAPTNMALVPGTSIPVCVNSVNCMSSPPIACTSMGPGSPFCTYYVANGVLGGTTIVYDGLTTTLTALAHVTPCDTYHLKMGVADAVDDVLDSGVFLKAGSLTSTSIAITSLGINPTDTGFGAQYCVRGCNPGMFVFHNTGNLSDSLTIHYLIGGTAINGFDYVPIADSITIPAHDSTDTVFIRGLHVPPTGTKTVILYILGPYSCGGVPVIIDSVALTIYDSLFIHINTPDTAICIGQNVFINTIGDPALVLLWSPAGTLSSTTILSPIATPLVTTMYSLQGSFPGSGCPPSVAQITIQVVFPPTVTDGAPVQTICVGSPLQLGVIATPVGAYYYSWMPTTYLNNSTIANPIVTPGIQADVEYYATVTTVLANCSVTDSFLLHVLPNDFTLFNLDTGVCFPPSAYQARTDGDTEFAYRWTPVNGVSNPLIINPILTPPTTLTYTLTASYPGCPDMKHSVAYSIEDPRVNIIPADTTFCIGSTVLINAVTTPADSPYTLSWSPEEYLLDPKALQPSFFSVLPGSYLYTLTITSGLGCTSTDSVLLHTSPPVRMTLNPGAVTIQYGGQLQLSATNISAPQGGALLYYWMPDDGSLDNVNISNPVASPKATTTYMVVGMNTFGCRDTMSETLTIDYMKECMPSGFSPNNDGLNDVFRLCNLHGQRMIEFSVYNRWGQMVYHNGTDPKKGWDGTFNGIPQDIGAYNYLYLLEEPDGTSKTYKGEVTLIR
jgi:gliding motility-associated-like protein